MHRLLGIIRQALALALLLALALAPVTQSATHGPATLMAEMDHPAHPAAPGAHDHDHHGTTDHDHTTSVILPATASLAAPDGRDIWTAPSAHSSGIASTGPRRPPRALT